MNTTRRQQTAEAELRRVCARIPEKARGAWTQRDYIKEMLAANPALGKWLCTASGAAGFWRRQRTMKPPARATDDGAAPAVPMHAAYMERQLDTAADALKREWLPIAGELRAMRLHKAKLNICSAYQRNTITPSTVDKIAASLDLVAFGALTVACRGGDEYFIVDGQNRWMASQRRPELGELNCLVFQSDGAQHEARIFAAINMNRTGVNASDKYRALVTGGDPIAVQLSEALDALGIEVVPRGANGQNQLAAISYVYTMASRDMRRCETILSCVQDITPGSPIFGELIRALDYLDRRIEGGVQNQTLMTRMRKIGAHKLMDAIAKARPANSGISQLGIAVLGEVNRGLAESKRILLQEV